MLPRQASDPFGFCGAPLVSVDSISSSLPSLSTAAHHILVFFPFRSAEFVDMAVLWHAEKIADASVTFKPLLLSGCAEAMPTNSGLNATKNAVARNLCEFIGSLFLPLRPPFRFGSMWQDNRIGRDLAFEVHRSQ